jgi:hypothetical protein
MSRAFVPDAFLQMLRDASRDQRTITRVLNKVTKTVPFGDGPQARVSAVLGEIARRQPRLFGQVAAMMDAGMAREAGR